MTGAAVVEIELSYAPLLWLYFTTPMVRVDGNEWPHVWGKVQVTLAPGRHQIAAWCPGAFGAQNSMGSIIVDVVAGTTYRVRYRPSPFFMPGSMKLV